MRKRAVAIVGDIRKRLRLKARDTNNWYEFNEEIGAVIKEILKLNESSSNEIGIYEFAEFVQNKFNTYKQGRAECGMGGWLRGGVWGCLGWDQHGRRGLFSAVLAVAIVLMMVC